MGEESRTGYVDPDLDGRAGRVRRAAFRRDRTAQRAIAAERRRADKRKGIDPRHILQLPEDISIERVDARRLVPSRPGSRRIESNRSVGKPGAERLTGVGEASDEQTARDEHDHGDRQLSDHERISQRKPSRALTAAALSGFERRDEISAHRLPGRRESEDETGGQRQRKSPAKHAEIGREVERDGQLHVGGDRGPKQAGRPESQRDGKSPAASASTVLSVRSCCATRQRPAPRERRMAISRRRTVALARNRLATLPQAISQTSPDAHSASVEMPRTCSVRPGVSPPVPRRRRSWAASACWPAPVPRRSS